MNNDENFPSLVQLQFRRAKQAVCQRNAPLGPQAYAELMETVGQQRPVERQNSAKPKSSAQVATSVGHQVVRQKPCGLKPGESKPFRITARFSETEREILVRQAENSRLTVSEYIRASVLGAGYISIIDPVKRELLTDINRELGHQGNNLNQIAKHLNAGTDKPVQGASMLAVISRSLMNAHMAVRQALAEGQESE